MYSPGGADASFQSSIAELSRSGIRFEPCSMPHSVGLSDVSAVIRLRRLLGRLQPDLIHLHSSKAGALGRLAAMMGLRQPVVYTPHATGAHRGAPYALAERILGRLRTSACIAVAPSEVEDLERFRVTTRHRIHQITNGIDIARVRSLAEAQRVEPVDITVCGRICEQKDPLTVAAAAAAVLRDRPQTTFRWVGDGELRATFEGELQRLNVSAQWEVTGWVERPYPYLAATRLVWLASRYESFGYVTLEAMSLGVPVIGTAVAGTRDLIIPEECGLLVGVGDHEALATETLRILSHEAIWLKLASGAERRAVAFSLRGMIEGTAQLYAALLDRGRAAPRHSHTAGDASDQAS